ncbi:transposase [Nonomuraea sp. NPDC049141]|uniref:transposase n=1 Tax=Nonomuraea sp. NPDC049141 TaxID=3155500 RepID=UPI0033D92E4B
MTVTPLRAGVAATKSSSPVAESTARLREFRAGWYDCLTMRADALFELTDAVLSAPTVTSLPYLSLEPVFRRSWGSLYDALARGRIDPERVGELLVACRPPEWPLTFAVDASTHPRPYAETSPGREWHHLSGPGGVDGGVPGWAWQHVTQLNLEHDSWVAPMDVVRVPTGGPAQTLAAAEQIRAMAARLRTAGGTGRKLFVHDAGYDLAVLVYELHGEHDVTGEHAQRCADLPEGTHHQLCGVHTVHGNDDIEVLVRIRNDRLLYRDPARPATAAVRDDPAATANRSPAPGPSPGASPTSSSPSPTSTTARSPSPPGTACTPSWTRRTTSPTEQKRRSCPEPSSASRSNGYPADVSPLRSRCGCSGPARASPTWTDAGDHIFAGSISSTT